MVESSMEERRPRALVGKLWESRIRFGASVRNRPWTIAIPARKGTGDIPGAPLQKALCNDHK